MNLSQVRSSAKDFGLTKLHKESGLARSRLYDFVNGQDLTSENLLKVLDCLGYSFKIVDLNDREALEASLAFYGVPLPQTKKSPDFTLEEALKGALQKAVSDPSYFEFVVYLLARQEINYQELADDTRQKSHRQLLGYAADLAQVLSLKKELQFLVLEMRSSEFLPFHFLTPSKGRFASMKTELKPNTVAKRWNVVSDTTVEVLRDRFRKWDKMNGKESE